MSLDGAFLHIVKTELIYKNLINSRVDKIHQPAREEIVITLRTGGGTEKLLLSANAVSARVCLTAQAQDNPKAPPMFCMLLRKHLSGGKLISITQDGLERILSFDFLCANEIGDMVTVRLTAEIMGRNSNIILMAQKEGEWRVIDSVKRVTDEISSVRRILPNVIYQPPPRENRLSLLTCDGEAALTALSAHSAQKADKALLKTFEGISPLFAREWVYYAVKNTEVTAGEILINKSACDRFVFFMNKIIKTLGSFDTDKPFPCAVSEKSNGKLIDFCFVNIEQYGSEAVIIPYPSANSLLDAFFAKKAEAERLKQRSGDFLKTLMQLYERISRRIETQKAELEDCKERDNFRINGDLISANIYVINKGQSYLEAENYETGENIRIPLDVRLTPAQNAQKYYSDYKKLDTAEKKLTKLISDGADELLYIDSVFDSAARAVSDMELSEIKNELTETGYLRGNKQTGGKVKKDKPLPPLRFVSSDGTTILAGRNNLQNDKLTLKTASPLDIWLHTQNIHGSHVIINCNGDKLSAQTLEEAAMIAAYCSKARNSSRVPVDYTEVRYVKKPAGAKPGMVIFTHNKTLFVTPDEEVYNRLKKS